MITAPPRRIVGAGASFAFLGVLLMGSSLLTPRHGLRGEYFANSSWGGSLESSVIDENIRFSKDALSLLAGGAENLSVVWRGFLFAPKSSVYRFTLGPGRGSSVYVDDVLVIKNEDASPARSAKKEISLSKGNHRLVIKHVAAGSEASIDFRWSETKTAKARMPKLRLYPEPAGLGLFVWDTLLLYLKPLLRAALWFAGVFFLLVAARAAFPRWDLLQIVALCLFIVIGSLYEREVFSRRSSAVSGCDTYAYLNGAELMARRGIFRTEFIDPLVPKILEGYRLKPREENVMFMLAPHGYYVYDLAGGRVYNLFPPGTSMLLYPFAALLGRSSVYDVIPVLNLILLLLLFIAGQAAVDAVFGLCLGLTAVVNVQVFENSVILMSDVPSLLVLSLSLCLLYRNMKKHHRSMPLLAGMCFGFAILFRYSNLLGAFPVAYLFWRAFKDGGPRQRWRNDVLWFSGTVFVFGVLPLALYTHRLFGTVFRLVYEPISQSRFQWMNLGRWTGYYLTSLFRTFGPAPLALMGLGLGAVLAQRRTRAVGVICLLAFSTVFLFHAVQSIENERYLMPAYPFLGLLFASGTALILQKVRRSFVVGLLVVALAAAYPYARSKGSYRQGEVRAEDVSAALGRKLPPNAVVFCDDLTGSLRLYQGIPGYRFMATDDPTLLETLDILGRMGIPVYFFLDGLPAAEHFQALLGRNKTLVANMRPEGRVRGRPLFRYLKTEMHHP